MRCAVPSCKRMQAFLAEHLYNLCTEACCNNQIACLVSTVALSAAGKLALLPIDEIAHIRKPQYKQCTSILYS